MSGYRVEKRRMWSVRSMLGCGVVVAGAGAGAGAESMGIGRRSNGGLTVVCSSRPKKKGTAHHMKTRPRKRQGWDINRKPTVYDPLPPLPPDWSLVIPADASSDSVTAPSPSISTSP